MTGIKYIAFFCLFNTTVVTETPVEDLATWQQRMADLFAMPDFGDWFARMESLVRSGQREFYTIEVDD